MYYSTVEARARSWFEEARALRERGLHHLAACCEDIGAEILGVLIPDLE